MATRCLIALYCEEEAGKSHIASIICIYSIVCIDTMLGNVWICSLHLTSVQLELCGRSH